MSSAKGGTIGIVGLAVLLSSWLAMWIAPHLVPSSRVPSVWLIAMVALSCATVAGVIASRANSRWWYFLVGAAVLSLALLLASVAV
jgi:hypothetical protein